MALRQATRLARSVSKGNFNNVSKLSTKVGPLTTLTVDDDGIAVLSLNRPPVNSLNVDLLLEMGKCLDEVASSQYKGLILTSALPKIFCAGLDLKSILDDINEEKLSNILWTMEDVWIKLFGSDFATAAAINGHAPAGGCLLAMSCEYRVMVDGNSKIGLNETAIGIKPSTYFIDTMKYTISDRQTELALSCSKLFKPDEALKVGLIDELSTDKDDAVKKCKLFIKKFDKIPPFARAATKKSVRGELLNKLIENRKKRMGAYVKYILEDSVQKSVQAYFASIGKKGN